MERLRPFGLQLRIDMKTFALLFVWVSFSIGLLFAIPVCLYALFFPGDGRAYRTLIQADKIVAALFGWGGDFTVSAECGSVRKGCVFCKIVCRILEYVEKNHCEIQGKSRI